MINPDDLIHYKPRDLFDSAIIRTHNSRVEYSRSRLVEILTLEYLATIESISQYSGMSPIRKKRLARKRAFQWIAYIQVSIHYGRIEERPVIVDEP